MFLAIQSRVPACVPDGTSVSFTWTYDRTQILRDNSRPGWRLVTERVAREWEPRYRRSQFDVCVEKDFNPSVNRGITEHRCPDSSHPFIFPPQLPLTPTIGYGMEPSERSEELPSPTHSPHAVFMVHYHSESWPISFWLSASVVSPN